VAGHPAPWNLLQKVAVSKRVNSSRADGDDATLIEFISAGMSFDTFNPA